VGWSRGAVIVATAAKALNDGITVGLKGEKGGKKIPAGTTVRFVGLFDAVNQFGEEPSKQKRGVDMSWARSFSPNVKARYHLIHTWHGKDPDYTWLDHDFLFPTEPGFTPRTPFNLPAPIKRKVDTGNKSTHGDVGRHAGALELMIVFAKQAGVPVR
jgi:hypothetical protein